MIGDLILALLTLISITAIIGCILYYLLITTEGVFLGQRVVTWLYDVYASRYDRIKGFTPEYEQLFIALPLLETIGTTDPLILDVATGTGRVPSALCSHPDFEGLVIGLDHSARMLSVAAENIEDDARVVLMRGDGLHLPFPDSTFEAVVCLEALEFMPDSRTALREMVRVLKPDSPLMITRRRGMGARWMIRRVPSQRQLSAFLEKDLGLVSVQVQAWQVDYEQVWAFKPPV